MAHSWLLAPKNNRGNGTVSEVAVAPPASGLCSLIRQMHTYSGKLSRSVRRPATGPSL